MYPNKDQYKTALSTLLKGTTTIIENGMTMIRAHYNAENHALSPEDLARAIGYDNFVVANSQYGKFAHELCDILKFTPPEAAEDEDTSWTYVLATYPGTVDHKGKKMWILREQLAAALEELMLVQKKNTLTLVEDIEAKKTYLDTLNNKNREQMIRARVGQGVFRDRVIKFWEGCSVSGCTMFELLMASHIKPWGVCDYTDALNPANGLLLTPNLDRAFDRGFITFADDRRIIISSRFKEQYLQALGITNEMKLLKDVSDWQRPFLHYHRENVFLR